MGGGGGRDEGLSEGAESLEKGRIGGRARVSKEWYQIPQTPGTTENVLNAVATRTSQCFAPNHMIAAPPAV